MFKANAVPEQFPEEFLEWKQLKRTSFQFSQLVAQIQNCHVTQKEKKKTYNYIDRMTAPRASWSEKG